MTMVRLNFSQFMKRLLQFNTVLIALAVSVGGCGRHKEAPTILPGAKGPFYERIAQPEDGVEVVGVDVVAGIEDVKHGQPHPPTTRRILPTGTGSRFLIEVNFNKKPAGECSLEIHNTTGKVEWFHARTLSTDNVSKMCWGSWMGQGKDTFPDGPYQARLKIGKDEVLRINWHIGDPKP